MIDAMVPPKLDELLQTYDVYGMPGTSWMKPRTNLLIDNLEKTQHDGFFTATQVSM